MSKYRPLNGYSKEREEVHANHESSRPLSDGYELVGIAGELELSQLTGLAPDLSIRPGGDGGRDNCLYLRYSVDVKTARKPYNLIHEEGKQFADIFILGRYSDDTGKVELLGWEWGKTLARAPTKDFGYGVINHYISAEELRDIGELRARVIKIQ